MVVYNKDSNQKKTAMSRLIISSEQFAARRIIWNIRRSWENDSGEWQAHDKWVGPIKGSVYVTTWLGPAWHFIGPMSRQPSRTRDRLQLVYRDFLHV